MALGEAIAHLGTGQFGAKQLGINPPLPHLNIFNAVLRQLSLHRGGGDQVDLGLVVHGLDQLPHQPFQHSQAVVL